MKRKRGKIILLFIIILIIVNIILAKVINFSDKTPNETANLKKIKTLDEKI